MPVSIAAALAVLVPAALLWLARAPASIDFETRRTPLEFADTFNSPGDVLWVDGKSEAWLVLGRPQWLSAQQVVSIVFSRPLAMVWWERAQYLRNNGLIPSSAFAPGKETEDSAISKVSGLQLAPLCAREDAPAAVIFPLEKGAPTPNDIPAAIWTLPHTQYFIDSNARFVWHHVDRYAAVSCAALRPSQPSETTGHQRGGV
jgi:hypothetical protein